MAGLMVMFDLLSASTGQRHTFACGCGALHQSPGLHKCVNGAMSTWVVLDGNYMMTYFPSASALRHVIRKPARVLGKDRMINLNLNLL